MKPRTFATVHLLAELKEYRVAAGAEHFADIDDILQNIAKFSGPLPEIAPKGVALKLATATGAKTKAAQPVRGVVDTASMTEAQIFDYYKRTSCQKDIEFFVANAKPDGAILDAFMELHAEVSQRGAGRPVDRRAYFLLVDRHWTAKRDPLTHMRCDCGTVMHDCKVCFVDRTAQDAALAAAIADDDGMAVVA